MYYLDIETGKITDEMVVKKNNSKEIDGINTISNISSEQKN